MTGLLAQQTAVPPADNVTTYVIMGIAGMLVIYVMTRMTKKKKRDPFDQPHQSRSLAQQRSTERQFEALLVQFSEMSRQMTAQLDTRAAKLEALIQDADERIERLKELNEQAPPRPDFSAGRFAPDRPAAESMEQTTAKFSPAAPAALDEVIAATKADDVAPSPTIDAEHAEVYRRADEGESVQTIATDLGRPSGEIELILALRPRT